MVNGKTFGATLWRYRDTLFIVLPALLFLPLPLLVEGQESKCGYVMMLMAVYWCTEALPLSVTGMIPLFLMPLMGLLEADDISPLYATESTIMFCGGLMVALAIEKCNLHKRIALGILVLVGVKPIWLMLGFIMPTWFLSMWISNTATTSMMLPILEAVLDKLGDVMAPKRSATSRQVEGIDNIAMDFPGDSNWQLKKKEAEMTTDLDEASGEQHGEASGGSHGHLEKDGALNGGPNNPYKRYSSNVMTEVNEPKGSSFDLGAADSDSDSSSVKSDRGPMSKDEKRFKDICKGMTLAVAYAANIGGTATLTGTTPNIIMKDAADEVWEKNGESESPVNFASYMVFAAPTAAITVVFIWLWLVLFYMGPRAFNLCAKTTEEVQKKEDEISDSIKSEFKSLGKMRYDEWWVLLVFLTMVMLWFFRSPGFMTGWGDNLHPGYIKDSVSSYLCVVALFIIPRAPFKWGSQKRKGRVEYLLDWNMVQNKFPWGILFLVGGGIALAEAAEASGLSDLIGEALTVFDALPVWVMTFLLALFTSLLTEVTSNTATCTIIMPIVATMAESLQINPLYLMMPCSVATSYAFMLPVATPPNAIAFSYNRITVLDMVKAGIMLKLTIFSITLAAETWGSSYFQFDEYPWPLNSTVNDTSLSLLRDRLHPFMTALD